MSLGTKEKKHAAILEIGDINTDGRCKNIATSFISYGGRVTFIGPSGSNRTDRYGDLTAKAVRVRSDLGSKIMYLHYWIRACTAVIKLKPDLIIAEDLYSLPPALVAAFFTGARVIYDAKEFYFALASLRDRPVTQRFWSAVEYLTIRYADAVITSGERDSDIIGDRYKISRPVAIHNHPPGSKSEPDRMILRNRYNIPRHMLIFLYQGWLLKGRGIPLMLEIARRYENVFLVIIGEGIMREEIEENVKEMKLSDRVLLTGALPYEELLKNSEGADVGCALIEDYGLSYRYARPNKMFEYIRASVPVLVSNFPAMSEIVDLHGVGLAVDPNNTHDVLETARKLIENGDLRERFRNMCKKAAEHFIWEAEEKKLFKLFDAVLN
jgi:glycosyltransferase involved in cell wall biosynthesis